MKNYYDILGVSREASSNDIKKAYRALCKKHHPDKNQGDPKSEALFKEIAEAYDVLSNPDKRKQFDGSNFRTHDSFRSDFKNPFGKGFSENSGFYNSRRARPKGKTSSSYSKPTSDHLNISEDFTLDLIKAIEGHVITVSYSKESIVDFQEFKKEKIDKTLKVKINLKDKFVPIIHKNGDMFLKIKLSNLGHEDTVRRQNVWGETELELLQGDYILNIRLIAPKDIKVLEGDIIQTVDIPLYKVLLPKEKVRVSTFFGKEYDAEIGGNSDLYDLKFKLESIGIKSKTGKIGDYIVKFKVILPNLSKLKKSDIQTLREYLVQKID